MRDALALLLQGERFNVEVLSRAASFTTELSRWVQVPIEPPALRCVT
jgi:hypothetical protein